MTSGGILGVRSSRAARECFSWDALWDLFDGDRRRLNLAHECVDRHRGRGTALRLQFADGHREEHDFAALAAWSGRFAHLLAREGVAPGDPVAIQLPPSLAFYGALFGVWKRGAVAVPLFTLFGPDAVAARVDDCRPRLLLVEGGAAGWAARFPGMTVLAADGELAARLAAEPATWDVATAADDLAVLQYTSGTTRQRPEAIRHTHRAVVTLMIAALYGVGLEAGDRYFCPSSPAWGHGLWHGTIAPLALGIPVGAYSGRFDPGRLLEGLGGFAIDNLAAAPTVYRALRDSGLAPGGFRPRKLSYTGEPMDSDTFAWIEHTWKIRPSGMYGSTEVGVVIADYPGFADYEVRPGALGQAVPGWQVAIVDAEGRPLPPGQTGEIAVRRRDGWFPIKDRGWMDADGYFHHAGRSDDAIVSAGWTMSAVEIEDTLLKHPDVREAAVVGVADARRGLVPKAFIVSRRSGPEFAREVQEFVRTRLGRHEYPRLVEVLDVLPRTPAGKVDRGALRKRSGEAG